MLEKSTFTDKNLLHYLELCLTIDLLSTLLPKRWSEKCNPIKPPINQLTLKPRPKTPWEKAGSQKKGGGQPQEAMSRAFSISQSVRVSPSVCVCVCVTQ